MKGNTVKLQLRKISTSVSVKGDNSFDENTISWMG